MNPSHRLIYLPLGGCGMFGANAYVYGWGSEGEERFILVDCGIAFPAADSEPGVDAMIPDLRWVNDRIDRLEAIFITHAHEDHVGAIGHLYPEMPGAGRTAVPVYARPFTATLARMKLEQMDRPVKVVKEAGVWPETVRAGPFQVGFLPVAHSIPEASALVIETPTGRIVHSGDFNLDRTPVVGEPHDPERLRQAAEGGVLGLVCDSTNVFNPRPGRSEATVAEPVADLLRECQGLFVATTFASNLGRLQSLAAAGISAGRSVAIVGRAMQRMLDVGHRSGMLEDFPPVIPFGDASRLPRNELLLVVTGSQGERQAVSTQLSWGNYRGIELETGDGFLFSSRTIPGNEAPVNGIKNRLAARGVRIFDATNSDGLHASGHACRPDIEDFCRIFDPDLVIPMHGENQHLREHARLAESAGYRSLFVTTGMLAELAPGPPGVVGHASTGLICVDGASRYAQLDNVLRDRRRMADQGVIAAAVEFETDGTAWCSGLSLKGLPNQAPGDSRPLADLLHAQISDSLSRHRPLESESDAVIERTVSRMARNIAMRHVGKKPEVIVLFPSDD